MEKTPAESLSEMEREAWRGMARAMYEAYGDSVGWKSVSGHLMPPFEALGARIEGAWCIAARTGSAYHLEHLVKSFVESRPDLVADDLNVGIAEGAFPAPYVDGLSRDRMTEMRSMLHKALDDMFEKLEYDPDGRLVNGIQIGQERKHTSVGIGGGRRAHIVTMHSISIELDETLASIERQIAEIKKRDGL